MWLKSGVVADGVVPELWYYLGRIDAIHREWIGSGLVVTDLLRVSSPWPSKHVPNLVGEVLAADLRRWELDVRQLAEAFAIYLNSCFDGVVQVVLEPEWLSADELEARGGLDKVAPHTHLELVERHFPRTD